MMASFLWDYSPYLIETNFFSLRYYSLFFGLGILFVWHRSVKELSGTIEKETLESSLFNIIIFMLVGSRLFHCFFYEFEYYSRNILEVLLPIRLNPLEVTGFQGLSSHGGFIGLIIYLFFILKKRVSQVQLNNFLDTILINSLILISLIRVGNLFNSEILGKPCSDFICVTFMSYDLIPRYPVQILEGIGYLLLFFIFSFLRPRMLQKSAKLSLLILVSVVILRFLLEFLKEPQSDFLLAYLNMGQLLSLFVVGFFVFFFKASKEN